MTKKYNFVKKTNKQDELYYKPEPTINKYYQACLFKNPWTNKFHIRKIVFDEMGECIDVSEHKLSTSQFEKFKKKYKSNQYKCYSTYSLSDVNLPKGGEMLTAESSLLGNEQVSYDGYMQF